MLKVFRSKNVARMVLWAILILILPAFVLWGTGGGGRSKDGGPKYAGVINNKKVSFKDFAESITSIRCQIMLNYANQPKMIDYLLKNKSFMGKLAWDRLIMSREARNYYKVKVTDKDVISFIRSHPIFLRNGQFDGKIYDYVLRYHVGLDARAFEEIVRENLAIQKMNDRLTKDIKITDEDVLASYKKDNEKIKISYCAFTGDQFEDKVKIDDNQIKEYYEKNKDEFLLQPPKDKADTTAKFADFEDVKAGIKSGLSEAQTRPLRFKYAEEQYKKIKDIMGKEGLAFEKACARLGIKTQETVFFSKADYLEGIGEARALSEAASRLKKGEISAPTETRKGVLIFTVAATQNFDEEKFKKDKGDYSKKLLENKKNKFLEEWLRRLEGRAKLSIDLDDYEKYYR